MNRAQADEIANLAQTWLSEQVWAAAFTRIGSSVYVDEPNDVDFAVLVKDGINACELAHELPGWHLCGDYDTQLGTWCSARSGEANLMLTHDQAFYDRYVLAMLVSQALRLATKQERIICCQVIRDGVDPESARASMGLDHFGPDGELVKAFPFP